jgi:peptidoglycan glycosyltransferase
MEAAMSKRKIKRNTIGVLLVLTALYLSLIAYFCYAVLFYGSRWFADSYNTRVKMDETNPRIIPGSIMDRNGVVLAETKDELVKNPTTGKDEKYYFRVYHDGAASVAHVVGFNHSKYGRMGVEAFYIYYLMGYNNSLIEKIYQKAFLPQERGNDVVLTVDFRLQDYVSGLMRKQGKKGSVVLINPKTGEILTMVSHPTFNPNDMERVDDDSLVNRATQGLYPPGSIFKLITAASALENIEDIRQRKFNCTGAVEFDGERIQCYKGEAHGQLDLAQALAVSCNTTFASLGIEIGWKDLLKTGKKFGFNDDFLFSDIKVKPSSLPISYKTSKQEMAWTAIGQGRVLVTPLHMAMIAATIANDGVMMEPKLLYSVVGRNGNIQKQLKPDVYRKVLDKENAEVLKNMMVKVVLEGTGKQAQSNRITIAGKTGTAEEGSKDQPNKNLAWFVGFAPVDNPTLAIAVLLEDVGQGETGGTQAAPLARKVLEKAVELGY